MNKLFFILVALVFLVLVTWLVWSESPPSERGRRSSGGLSSSVSENNVKAEKQDASVAFGEPQQISTLHTGRVESSLLCARAVKAQQCSEYWDGIKKGGKNREELAASCQDMAEATVPGLIRAWRSAAEAGSYYAAKFYILGRPFRIGNTIESLDELSIFKEKSEKFALQLVAKGDFNVGVALADAYYPFPEANYRPSLLSQAVEKDAAKALILYEKLGAFLHSESTSDPLVEARLKVLRSSVDASSFNGAASFFGNSQPFVRRGPIDASENYEGCVESF
uniref:hypothetical protein n=1 Tax=Xanthomonas sp. 0924 TaxID=2835534 RepID=UPI003F7E875F